MRECENCGAACGPASGNYTTSCDECGEIVCAECAAVIEPDVDRNRATCKPCAKDERAEAERARAEYADLEAREHHDGDAE